ncbi:MAG TPA: restriction endonuclease [Bacilli bacterium]|nr:restriction endonuclease [Bacilli bacterium]
MNRGYAGFYNGVYLRSSYEYAFAKYLDHNEIQWTYEERCYDLDGVYYIPDFFIYEANRLSYVVEVKSNVTEEIQKARSHLKDMQRIYGIKGKLILYEDLKHLYQQIPYSITSTIKEWIDSKETSNSKKTKGERNPHFGLKHSNDTKVAIGQHTKELWENDPKAKAKMIEGSRKGAKIVKQLLTGVKKVPREVRQCIHCNRPFTVLKTSVQKYCSQKCVANANAQSASQKRWRDQDKIHSGIRELVLRWSIEHQELLADTPFNKIKTTLAPLLTEIEQLYGIKDLRIITKAVLGKDLGRKELLRVMKEHATSEQSENVRRPRPERTGRSSDQGNGSE